MNLCLLMCEQKKYSKSSFLSMIFPNDDITNLIELEDMLHKKIRELSSNPDFQNFINAISPIANPKINMIRFNEIFDTENESIRISCPRKIINIFLSALREKNSLRQKSAMKLIAIIIFSRYPQGICDEIRAYLKNCKKISDIRIPLYGVSTKILRILWRLIDTERFKANLSGVKNLLKTLFGSEIKKL
ncbi:hypothetical protein EDEG_03147 [Edhazardia aedis USNM 41457]|uniref:Uncharacterized protein n=1 Tax=Edhazardia aedis (strain USNM 41457) TaxID=1003232 RepID=J8ZRW8_EDHAE|nr:hypothetical protein EDEG_03147 [Edhazardia aedis USNM 41457]|eukprot:EJW02443.1 hypothetical protein EDEG_03147 [Edhazardia aedis USNM 41457]